MAQSIKNKIYKTPLGTIARYTGRTITVLVFLTMIAAACTDLTILANYVPILKDVLFLGLAIWALAQALDLYEGQWSKKLCLGLNATTAILSLAAICYIGSIFGLDRGIGHLFLIIGFIMEFILAGKMMKEARLHADSLNKAHKPHAKTQRR